MKHYLLTVVALIMLAGPVSCSCSFLAGSDWGLPPALADFILAGGFFIAGAVVAILVALALMYRACRRAIRGW